MKFSTIAFVAAAYSCCFALDAHTVIRGHHIEESYEEYLGAVGCAHEIPECATFLTATLPSDPRVVKLLKHTKRSYNSLTASDLIETLDVFTYDKLTRCMDLQSRLSGQPAVFTEYSAEEKSTFVDGKLVQYEVNFGIRDYLGHPVGPDVSVDDVMADFASKFGEPERGTKTMQNGFGAELVLKTAMWRLPDVYIVVEEQRPFIEGLFRGASSVVTVTDRESVDKRTKEKLRRPNVAD